MSAHEPIEATEKLFTRTRSRAYQGWARFGIYVLIVGVFALLLGTHRLDRLEDRARDTFLKSIVWGQVRPDIALIEISRAALDEIGAWPWPRSYYAIMVRLLSEWKAAAIVLDLDLSETTDPKNDQDLLGVLEKIPTPVYLPVELKDQKEKKFWLHGMPVVLETNEGKKQWVYALPEFRKAARGVGHSYLEPDEDGILRRFTPFIMEGKDRHLFLPLRVAFDQMKKPLPLAGEWGPFADFQGKVLIPWSRDWDREVSRYNYAELIHSFYAVQNQLRPVIDPAKIAGKICFVGPTVAGATELKITPLEASCPRIDIYAQVLNAAMTGDWVRPVPAWGNMVCLLAIGAVTTVLFMVFHGTIALVGALLLALGWIGFCFGVFAKWHLWFYVVQPVLLMLCLFIFSAIYAQMTVTREKSHLFHLATRDGLTELYVIRHFRLIMNQIVREVSLRKEPLAVILLDIDYFKKINDTYGHPAGDMVLKKTAEVLLSFIRKRRPFREIDFAARYGGEEFIIMLRKAGIQEAAGVAAERIRKKIEETRFEWEGKLIPVTISLGVAVLHFGENVPDPMVHRADAALYRAKESGRNRVCRED